MPTSKGVNYCMVIAISFERIDIINGGKGVSTIKRIIITFIYTDISTNQLMV